LRDDRSSDDIPGYRELAGKIRDAYNATYFKTDSAWYDNNTVTANILSLQLGLVPEGYEERVFENIVQKTERDFGDMSAPVSWVSSS